MRKMLVAAMAVVLGTTTPVVAADPVITARVKSLNDLTGYAEYLGGLFGQEDQAKQAAQLVRGLADPDKGIEGIDPARPIGLYGVVTEEVVDSYAVIVVPVADEKALLELLTGRLNLEPKKDGGVYQVKVPNVPFPVFFRSANKSAYVTVRSADPLADDKLIAPATLFAGKENAAAVLKVFPDRIPEQLRKMFLGQFEMQLAQKAKAELEGKDGAFRFGYKAALRAITAAVTAVTNDTEEIAVRLGIDPDADDLGVTLAVKPKDGSDLAGVLNGAGKATGAAAGRHTPADTLFSGGLRFDVPESFKDELDGAVDAAVEELVKQAKDQKKLAKKFLSAFVPTLKSGVIDLGVVVTPGDEAGQVRAVVELRVVGGEGIEKAVKDISDLIPDDKAGFAFDKDEVNDVSIHKIELEDADDLEKKTGSSNIWLGTGDTRLLIAIGPDSGLLKTVAKKDAGLVPVAKADLSLGKTVQAAMKDLKLPDEGADGKDTAKLSVTGGDALTVKFAVKGKAVRLLAAIDKLKKED